MPVALSKDTVKPRESFQAVSTGLVCPDDEPITPGQHAHPLGLFRITNLLEERDHRRKQSSRTLGWLQKFAGKRAKELSKQRWLLNLISGVETHHQDIIMDLNDERNRLELVVHVLETEKDGFVARQEAAVAQALEQCKEAHAVAGREAQRRIDVEEEMVHMQQIVAEARTVADTASCECERLRNAVLAVSEEEAETHKNITARARQLATELATTKRDRNEKRRVCRRQALELASVRSWHNDALLAQAKQFKQNESNAALVAHENGYLHSELEAAKLECAKLKKQLLAAQNPKRFS